MDTRCRKRNARRIAELNGSALAMTEHGNVMSHVKPEKAAHEIGVRPIFGIELYCGEIDPERRGQLKNHLTVLAKDQEGYRNILQLVSDSYKEGFYHEPVVSGSMLGKHRRWNCCAQRMSWQSALHFARWRKAYTCRTRPDTGEVYLWRRDSREQWAMPMCLRCRRSPAYR